MVAEALSTLREIIYLPVDKIKPNPYQPRRFFERGALDELANSIREYGVIQPISVRLTVGYGYELIAGERRLRASKIAGLMTIPAIVVNISEQDSAILAIVENLQRKDLNFLEEAEGYANLIHDYSFTQEELASKIGKRQSTIANKLRLLRLPKVVQSMLLENDLTERHARALLKLENEEEQLNILKKVTSEELTVKKTEELVDKYLKQAGKENTSAPKFKIKRFIRDIRLFTNTVKQAVDLMLQSGVDAVYTMKEMDDGCEIVVRITY